MRVLFIYRGYGETLSNSVIDFQRDSLVKKGIEVKNFLIIKGGVRGYIRAIWQLKKLLKHNRFDILHAHYSFSGFIARLATRKPVICSLMGSDVLQQGRTSRVVTRLFYKHLWKATIVKSPEIKKLLPKSILIPNGVDFSNFKMISKDKALQKTGFNPSGKNIIFVAQNPKSYVKNLPLAKKSISLLNDENITLHLISGKAFTELPYFYTAADLLLLTSLSEGSSNVIKEAMACNLPIVSVDVGDVKEILGDTEGTYLCPHDTMDIADKIQSALNYGKRTNGRERMQHLDNKLIAEKIVNVYKSVLNINQEEYK